MRASPSERFLGVPPEAEARTLLDISDGARLDKLTIERALRARMTMIDRHPGGDSPEAEELRRELKRAAELLQDDIGKEPPEQAAPSTAAQPAGARRTLSAPHASTSPRTRTARPAIALTEFDRQVLGTLVGSGGWNRASRARLVSIAAVHRVTVHGLLTVMRRLNDYARSGGARLDVATITAGQRTLTPASVDLPHRQAASLAERLLPELKEPTPATTVKWSLIFGLLAVVLGGGLILLVVRDRGEPIVVSPLDDAAPPAVVQTDEPSIQDGAEHELNREPAKYPQLPTFAVSIDDAVSPELRAQCARLPEELDHVARRVRVSDEPAESMYRDWAALIHLASRTWVAIDEPLNRQIVATVRRVFEEASAKPDVSDRLLNEIGVGASVLIKPNDIWSSTWRVERLAELVQSLRLSPALRERAELMLAAALANGTDTRTLTPPEIATAWLASITDWLVDGTESSVDPYQAWELWLAAVDRLATSDERDRILLTAAEAILVSSVELTQQSPSVNVLGRLLEEVDWRSGVPVKQRVTSWFDEDARGITGDDLWVVTSIIATRAAAPWFKDSLIVPRGADAAHRRRVRDQIAGAWPASDMDERPHAGPAGRGIDVDPKLSKQWRTLQASLLGATPMSQPPALAEHIALLARLNEAASLLERGETTGAKRVLQWIEQAQASASIHTGAAALSQPRGSFVIPQGTRTPGQAIGQDGVWAAAYAQAGAAADARINLIRALRSTAGTDLGPADASTFVRETYRATPAEVRAMAQSVAMMFITGPNVSQQLLDQLPDAIPNEDTSQFLQRYAGRHLAPVRSERWGIEARQMLIQHSLSLLPSTDGDIDRASDIVADAVAQQGPADQHDLAQQAAMAAPSAAAELVRQSWAEAMRGVVSAEPVPGDLEFIERRHRTRKQLAQGPIQSFVASRIGHLELFAFAVTAEQPALRVTVTNMLAESTANRASMPDALQQAIEVERALSKLHALRMRERAEPSNIPAPGMGGRP
jgi:hypothetical protein